MIAALRLLANVVVLLLVAKNPAVELVQLFEPRVPGVTVPHEKIPVAPPPTESGVKLPGVPVTVNVLPLV